MTQHLRRLQDLDVNNKTVIVRADLNVPIFQGKIEDNTRITKIVPTIQYLIERNAKVVILSHFGRPNGMVVRNMSLAPVVDELSIALGGKPVKFGVDCIGSAAEEAVTALLPGDVILMENLRFYKQEEENDQKFAQQLANLGDIYVNDAFSASHRTHASISTLAHKLPSVAGLLLQDELTNLENLLSNPSLPMAAIVGGSKVSTKLKLLNSLTEKANIVVIGGAMANTFLKATGHDIGRSLYEPELLTEAKTIIDKAHSQSCELILPIDVVIAPELSCNTKIRIVPVAQVTEDNMILDIGPKTLELLATKFSDIKSLVWNGPMGAFEYPPFNIGTISLARTVAELTNSGQIVSIAGGGDIVSALTNSGLISNFTYISTAGGAFLEWLEGEDLPGVSVLKSQSVTIKAYDLM